ncbi:MAG: PAS domain S-box protein [Syntrophorhabdus sp.]|nr:PAS domain S-box protein [Syntrophorhabdus sp.]
MTEKDGSISEFDRLFGWPDVCRSLFRVLITSIREGFFITDGEGAFLYASPSLGMMLDHDPGQLLRMSIDDVDPEKRFRGAFGAMGAESYGVSTYEATLKRKGGEPVDVEVTLARYSVPAEGQRCVGLVRHIGDRKRAETALRESEERFKLFSHASQEALVLLNDAGKVLYANPAALKITGREDRRVSDMEIGEFLRPYQFSDEQKLQMAIAEVMPVSTIAEEVVGSDRLLDLSVMGAEGVETNIELCLLSEKVGDKWHMIALFRDVTEKKSALERLRKSEEKFRRLFEETKDAVFMSTPEGRIVDINRAGLDLFGFRKKEEMLDLDLAQDLYCNPEDRTSFRAAIEKYGSASMHDLALKRSDGTVIVVSITVNAVYDEVGNVVIFHGIIRDLTGIRQLEQQVRAFQKIDAVRELIGDMAHHFNNILNIIVGNAQLAKISPDCTDEMGSYLSAIEEEVFRAADMVDALLASGSRHPMHMKTVDVGSVVRDFEKMVRRIIGDGITIVLSVPSTPIFAKIDVARIAQAFLNLVVNAREAMDGAGTLTIRVYTENMTDVTTTLDGKIVPGSYAVISVSDTGRGMDAGLREKIFEPFYTTDASGEKKGLGLSVVLGIVKQHGGFVICDSEEGRGATFKFYLPVSEEKTKVQRLMEQGVGGGTETVLIGEDEDALRKIAADFLRTLGYRVVAARNGDDALALFREKPGEIDMALLDIAMPGMNGLDVYHEIKKVRPDIDVLFMTGYSLDAANISTIQNQGISIIRKPFTMTALARRIREILDKEKTV